MSKFKKGDRVRVVRQPAGRFTTWLPGSVGTVVDNNPFPNGIILRLLGTVIVEFPNPRIGRVGLFRDQIQYTPNL